MLSSLRLARIHPFDGAFVILLQEIITDTGKHFAEEKGIQLFAGKLEADWRGTGIAHTGDVLRTSCKMLRGACSCALRYEDLKFLATSAHVPHHATIEATDEILDSLSQQLRHVHKAVLGVDANETFHQATDGKAAHGDPEQMIHKSSHFPYNTRFQPRRIDYIMLKHLPSIQGDVLAHRDVASSDHEPIWVQIEITSTTHRPSEHAPEWGSRRLRGPTEVKAILDQPILRGDSLAMLTKTAIAITVPGKVLPHFEESINLKQLRCRAIRQPPGRERRQMWKEVCRSHTREHRKWRQKLLDRTAIGDWTAKKALLQSTRNHDWALPLTDDPSWKESLSTHFAGIFQKQRAALVDAAFAKIDKELALRCKAHPWRPFTMEEMLKVRKRWKNGRSCGPDLVSHEAMKALLPHPYWGEVMRELFSDMLYTAKIPQSIERGVSILLAKNSRVELLMILRRVCRVAFDFGIEMYVAKLDIRKAFDSVFQESMALRVQEHVDVQGGMPWEARAWVSLLRSDTLTVTFCGENLVLRQTNGVRQGSPDSPVAFGSVVARDLDECLGEAKTFKPLENDPPPED
ncbi:unnamed protein product, partial [Symbiodinium necroappetens]